VSYEPLPARGACPSGKVQYANRKQAKIARARHPRSRTKLRVYRCPDCGWVHLGHQPDNVRNGTYDKADWLAGKEQA